MSLVSAGQDQIYNGGLVKRGGRGGARLIKAPPLSTKVSLGQDAIYNGAYVPGQQVIKGAGAGIVGNVVGNVVKRAVNHAKKEKYISKGLKTLSGIAESKGYGGRRYMR